MKKWPKGTTCWPAYAGTSETLSAMPPREVVRQQSSLTLSTSCWTFSTMTAVEMWMSDRKAMTQHQEMMPRTRTYLWMRVNEKNEVFEVWELVERCPPSTQLELEPELSAHDVRRENKCACPPGEPGDE